MTTKVKLDGADLLAHRELVQADGAARPAPLS
jgi:hypothetical protein